MIFLMFCCLSLNEDKFLYYYVLASLNCCLRNFRVTKINFR